jgi:predicted nuclease of predicted toxin-antitoxin system
MRLLFDENISFRIIRKIADQYPDSESSVRLKLTGKNDTVVWNTAKAKGYSIVTFDEDYLNLSQLYGFPPKVIFIRPGNLTTEQVTDLLLRNYDAIHTFLTDLTEERGCLELFDFSHF